MSKGAWRDCPRCGDPVHMNSICHCGGNPFNVKLKSTSLDQIADKVRKENGLDKMPGASATWGPFQPACETDCQACGKHMNANSLMRWIRFEGSSRKYVVCRECFLNKKMRKHQDLHHKILKRQSRLVSSGAWFNNGCIV